MLNKKKLIFMFRGVKVTFIPQVINQTEELLSKYYFYEIRHGKNANIPVTIEPSVNVDFYGTLISNKPLDLIDGTNGDPYIVLKKRERDFFQTKVI